MSNPNAKILVVDDVVETRNLLLRRLTRLGFHDIDRAEPEPFKRLAGRVRAFESGRPAFDDMAASLLTFKPMPPS